MTSSLASRVRAGVDGSCEPKPVGQARKPKTDSESIMRMWQANFPDIKVTETRWFENYEQGLVQDAMRIAAENIKNGKKLKKLDEKNVGKYIMGILRNLKGGEKVRKSRGSTVIEVQVSIAADYKIREQDKSRFTAKLTPAGDCLLFKGASTTGGYRKFWANNRSLPAHYFAFFSDFGYLPPANGLGGTNGLQVAHSCRNRSCCNPRHLRLTTKTVNLRERVHKGVRRPAQSAERTDYGSPNGMAAEVTNSVPYATSQTPQLSELGITDPCSPSTGQEALRQEAINSSPQDLSI